MNKYVAEFLGTFALVFAGTGAIVVNDLHQQAITHVGIALTFGLVVLAVIYAIGDVSGAHINPAVTLGFWSAGRFSAGQVIPYVVCQLAGAVLASGMLRLLFPEHGTLGATLPSGSLWQSFVFEFILTWFLMFVVLCVSTGSKEVGVLAGVAVGSVVALEAMFAGPVCGASMNPARSLGPALVSGHVGSLWLYLVAPVLGAFVAVLTARIVLGGQRLTELNAAAPASRATPEPEKT